jgi:cysteine-rich repeat protein
MKASGRDGSTGSADANPDRLATDVLVDVRPAGTGGSGNGGRTGAGGTTTSGTGGTARSGGASGTGGTTSGTGGTARSGGASGTGGRTGTGGGGVGGNVPRGTTAVAPADLTTCGNGRPDTNELCDDGNTLGFDGCSRTCQIEDGFDCPTWGVTCVLLARCGDGLVAASEACDDDNTVDGDGCAADCRVIGDGFLCPIPGRLCQPLCGDGRLVATETCDDGNSSSGDGCSSMCQVEPGFDCPTIGKPCLRAACGNGKVEPGEQCDCGVDPGFLPNGCVAINGLFLGDGHGCSRNCTKEPSCRDSTGKNRACDIVCGDGVLDASEACEDGNRNNGDGCSSFCKVEAGFTCSASTYSDSVACQSGSGQCLALGIVYRDFQPENASGGHPDFPFLGTRFGGGSSPTTLCVPDASGPVRNNDGTARCWGMASDDLSGGKPQPGTTTTCDCQFTDWNLGIASHIPDGYTALGNDSPLSDGKGGFLGGSAGAAVTTTSTAGVYTGKLVGFAASEPPGPIWKGKVPAYKDTTSFRQWWNDDPTVNKTFKAVLEMPAIGSNVFQYASKVHLAEGGFFPLDALNPGQVTLCNLAPYWNRGNGSPIWSSCTGDQYLFPPNVTASDCPVGDSVDDGCWVQAVAGQKHDFYFTDEAHHYFVYDGSAGFSLMFYGDDDLFVFINGKLVLDLGGTHAPIPGKVTISGNPGDAHVIEGGCLDTAGNIIGVTPGTQACSPRNSSSVGASIDDYRDRNVSLGLVSGKMYELAIFGAERQPPASNFQLTISGAASKRSDCMGRCGDGVVAGGEQCDCGDGAGTLPAGCRNPNSDTAYGGCTTKCWLGPRCGDGMVNGVEECDLGRDNGSGYGMDGCSAACSYPHFCGDGNVDVAAGEECDLGTNNGLAGMPCSSACLVVVTRSI